MNQSTLSSAPTTTLCTPIASDVSPSSAEKHAIKIKQYFALLLNNLSYLSATDLAQIKLAFDFANKAHQGQLRNNGDPYITHPIAVAEQCAVWKLDAQTIMAALLHDAMEDCDVTKTELATLFGAPVAELVDGLTKLDKLECHSREENQAESFRKMLLAMARDVRVILVKLADRSHNMRTLSDMPRQKWGRISSETLEIYAPIAHRLGLNEAYRELQNLSFSHIYPWRFTTLEKAIAKVRNRQHDLLHKVETQVKTTFATLGLPMQISGREKPLYSIYQKMKDKHLSFSQVIDMYGFRIIVPSITDCYTALGILHQAYKPVPGRFKDHIAMSKVNGYQSLHTTLVGPSNINIEFQIRTEEMHLVAESGVAAHWLYKINAPEAENPNTRLGTKWLQSLLDIQNETRDASEFWDHVKGDLFPDAIYVFTPKSQILSLPRGATVIDFAYAIHTNIGDRAVAARVNNEQVPLRTELKNGDVIEVATVALSSPNPAWLGFVRTGRARSKIRNYLKTLAQTESKELGRTLLTQALRAEGIKELPELNETNHLIWDKLLRFTSNKDKNELLTEIGLGKRIASIVAKRLMLLLSENGLKPDVLLLSQERYMSDKNGAHDAVVLDGSENASIQYAQCCRPIPGDAILGYLGRGEGLMVHTEECALVQRLQLKDSERFISVAWAEELVHGFETGIILSVTNRKGILSKVAAELARCDVDIAQVQMGEDTGLDSTDLRFVIVVRNKAHLDSTLRQLGRTESILNAQRISPARSHDN